MSFLRKIGLLLVLQAGISPLAAQEISTKELLVELQRLQQRLEKLEVEKENLEKSLQEPHISENEPELAARLKAVESQTLSQQKAVKTIQDLDGIEAGFAVTTVGQSPFAGQVDDHKPQLNIRADATLTLPGGDFGESKGKIFTHLRAGQGSGIGTFNNGFNSFNSTAFSRPNADAADAALVLAEAWYQLETPFGEKDKLEVTLGKLDPFAFFDQNLVAGDETKAFLSQAFVHNPLLDIGGEMGMDRFGFSPGLRLGWSRENNKNEKYGLSAAILESGNGASFARGVKFPFSIIQAETTQSFISGLAGNYRLYAWHNRQGGQLDGNFAKHQGFGVSIDQKIADYASLFARYGQSLKGQNRFDKALTLGGELGGSYWNRGSDVIGLAWGWLNTSSYFQHNSLTVDANNDGTPDYNYRAKGSEQLLEIYYRYHLLAKLDISPSIQYLSNAGGRDNSKDAYAAGLRIQFNY